MGDTLKADLPGAVNAATSWWWLLHFVDRDPLRALLRAIGEIEKWTADEIEWATAGAMAAPDWVLNCYRALAVEDEIILPLDDGRRCCNQCANLRRLVCSIAHPGGVVSANRGY